MADDFGSHATKIENLYDNNYFAWDQKITLIISLKDLDDFIGYGAPVEEDRLLHWKNNDRKERAIIGLLLSDQHLEHVRDVEAAKKCGELQWMSLNIMTVSSNSLLAEKPTLSQWSMYKKWSHI